MTDAPSSPPAWQTRLPVAGLALLLLGLAALSIPDHIQAGDAGEFATVMLQGGVPHPSGYPWMRILGLPAQALAALGMPPTRAAAWPCALAGVLAWLLLWPVLARWSSRGAATVAIAVLATASPVLLHVNDSEVWGLHLLGCASIIRVACRDQVRPWQLGLVFGLAVSHHLSAVMMLPLVVGAALPRPFNVRALLLAGAQGVGAGVAGLLPYATLMLGSGGPWRWGDTQTLNGLVHHVSRADYGVFQLSLHEETPAVWSQWTRVVETVGNAVSGGLTHGVWFALAALVLIAVVAIRRPEPARPAVWWGLWGSLLASTLAFPAAHNIDPTSPFGAWILERFDLLTILLWSVPWAVAASRLAARVDHRAARIVLGIAAAVLLMTQVARSLARGLPSTDAGVERYATDLLKTPAPGPRALVFGTDDHRIFPILFVHNVRGVGADVLYIDASLLSQRWYREHLRARWPAMPDVEKPLAMMGTIWRDPQLRDTPIYLANMFSRPATTLPIVPQGVLWRVLPPGSPPITPEQVVTEHLAAIERYGEPPIVERSAAHPWTGDLNAAYNEGTRRLLAALHAEGREADARALLDDLGPWAPPPR